MGVGHRMRSLCGRGVFLLFAACGGPPASPSTPAAEPSTRLSLRTQLSPLSRLPVDVTIASARLHLQSLTAVSDRSATDTRASVNAVDLEPGGTNDALLSDAPPGIYSKLVLNIGSFALPGVLLSGQYKSHPLRVTLWPGDNEVDCDDPAALTPGALVRLALRVSADQWFEGVVFDDQLLLDDGEIVIGAGYHERLAAQLSENIAASFQLACAASN
jgi:hypothetical protein